MPYKKEKRIKDVLHSGASHTVRLKYIPWYSRLASFFRTHLGQYRNAYTVVVVLIIATVYFGYAARASTATFFARSCLGDWEQSDRASGEPDGESAVLRNGFGRIFCGDFGGELPEGSRVVSMVARLDLRISRDPLVVVNEEAVTEEGLLDPLVSTTTSSSTVEIDTDVETETREESEVPEEAAEEVIEPVIEEAEPEEEIVVSPAVETPAEEEPTAPEASESEVPVLLNLLSPKYALAQEVEQEQDPVEEIEQETELQSASTDDVTGDTVSESEALELGTSTSTSSPVEDTVSGQVVAESGEESPVLAVSYTTNGDGWVLLGEYKMEDSGEILINLPPELYGDLDKVQISVQAINAFDAGLVAELDYVSLEVGYVELEKEEGTENPGDPIATRFSYQSPGFMRQPSYSTSLFADTEDAATAHSCFVTPFLTKIAAGGVSTLTLTTRSRDVDVPYQIRTSDLLKEVELSSFSDKSSTTTADGWTEREYSVVFRASAEAGRGSYALIFAQDLDYGFSNISTSICKFNIEVEPSL